MNINELVKKAHENAVNKGFYDSPDKNIGELLMLIVSELGEALEAHRKGKHADPIYLESETTKHEAGFEFFIKDTFEDEIADTVIRIADMCGYLGIEFDESEYTGGMCCPENTAECLFDIVGMISKLKNPIIEKRKDVVFRFLDLIRQIKFFCECNDINIEKHIALKMRYNETREYKHGKRY